jgi:hypothetical protein
LFGLFWIGVAAIAHRVLSNTARAERWQLTNKNILKPSEHLMNAASVGVALTAPTPPTSHGSPPSFGDGSSGGAGASRGF